DRPPAPVPAFAGRAASRAGTFVDTDDEPDGEPAALDPVEPAEPVVSANATGIATTAEPTPSVTARAPTRPT
ncbi:MAG: hypothetical protein WCJ53_15355, partial [Mycobacteriaceae bacterium]